jgi:enoyl-CoA hydratase/carnithine racemase
MTDVVLVERGDGGIVTVTLNRPERLNALTWAMWEGVGEAMALLDREDEVRCVVLRGAGDKAFAPGADIAEFSALRSNFEQARAYGRLMHETMRRISQCRHPTVALIRGICVGGGLELAMLCDIRICGEGSRFGVPINRLGVTMGYPEITALIKLVGRQTALEILLEGRVFGAEEALQKRLVNRVVEDADVEREAYATAERIAAGAPLVARWHKQFIERLTPRAEISREDWNEGFACFDTEDYREGVDAFLAKRKPQFKGK